MDTDATELDKGALDLSAKDGAEAIQKMIEGRKWFISFLNGMAKILEVAPEACWQTNEATAFDLRQLAKEMEIHCETLGELMAADKTKLRNKTMEKTELTRVIDFGNYEWSITVTGVDGDEAEWQQKLDELEAGVREIVERDSSQAQS